MHQQPSPDIPLALYRLFFTKQKKLIIGSDFVFDSNVIEHLYMKTGLFFWGGDQILDIIDSISLLSIQTSLRPARGGLPRKGWPGLVLKSECIFVKYMYAWQYTWSNSLKPTLILQPTIVANMCQPTVSEHCSIPSTFLNEQLGGNGSPYFVYGFLSYIPTSALVVYFPRRTETHWKQSQQNSRSWVP